MEVSGGGDNKLVNPDYHPSNPYLFDTFLEDDETEFEKNYQYQMFFYKHNMGSFVPPISDIFYL